MFNSHNINPYEKSFEYVNEQMKNIEKEKTELQETINDLRYEIGILKDVIKMYKNEEIKHRIADFLINE